MSGQARRAATIALLLLAPAAASHAETGFLPPRHTPAQQAAAERAYNRCLVQAAARLDDRRSDPSLIADAMGGLCIDQQFQMAVAIADGRRQSYLILIGTDLHDADARKAVLRGRAARATRSRTLGP